MSYIESKKIKFSSDAEAIDKKIKQKHVIEAIARPYYREELYRDRNRAAFRCVGWCSRLPGRGHIIDHLPNGSYSLIDLTYSNDGETLYVINSGLANEEEMMRYE